MRDIKFKRKLYSVINKASLVVSGIGASGIIASALNDNVSTVGVTAGLGVAVTGLTTHLIMHNREYYYESVDDYIDSLKDNSFYRKGLISELDKLILFKAYLTDPSRKFSETEEQDIDRDLHYDELLLKRKLEILDTDNDAIYVMYDSIECLERIGRSKKYTELKEKFFHLNNAVTNYSNDTEEDNNKILVFKNRSN